MFAVVSVFSSTTVAAMPCPLEMVELFRAKESCRPFSGDFALVDVVEAADVDDEVEELDVPEAVDVDAAAVVVLEGWDTPPPLSITRTEATPARATTTRTAAHAAAPMARLDLRAEDLSNIGPRLPEGGDAI